LVLAYIYANIYANANANIFANVRSAMSSKKQTTPPITTPKPTKTAKTTPKTPKKMRKTRAKVTKLPLTDEQKAERIKDKKAGKAFEKDFTDSLPPKLEMYWYRFRDSAGAWGGGEQAGGKKTRFTTSNMCDFEVCPRGRAVYLELKSTKDPHKLPFNNLKDHQVKEMAEAEASNGVRAFFLLNFRALAETYAVPAGAIALYYNNAPRASFPIEWVRQNGTRIGATLKKVHYTYAVVDWLATI